MWQAWSFARNSHWSFRIQGLTSATSKQWTGSPNIRPNSLAAVPLIVRGEVVGVLEALNKRDDEHYTEEDITILETLGALAAQAMKNVGLE